MQTKAWWVLVFVSALLPWLAIEVLAFVAVYLDGPIIWFLEPPISETRKTVVLFLQTIYEGLVFSIPVGLAIAWLVTGRPFLVALLVVLGYLISFSIWSLIEGGSVLELGNALFLSNHWPVYVLLGLSVFGFSALFRSRGKPGRQRGT